jgi:predicted permease
MTLLINVVLPIFVVAGLAALAQRRLHLDVPTLSRGAFYLFAPALVFDSLTRLLRSQGLIEALRTLTTDQSNTKSQPGLTILELTCPVL